MGSLCRCPQPSLCRYRGRPEDRTRGTIARKCQAESRLSHMRPENYRHCVPANRDGGSGQFFENPSGLAFPANDSAINPSNLSLVLAEEVVKINNIQCIVFAEQPERSLGRKSSPNGKNYVLSLKRSRRIGSIRFNSDFDSARRAVYPEIHEQLLFDR